MNFLACGKRSGCSGSGYGTILGIGNPLKLLWAAMREFI